MKIKSRRNQENGIQGRIIKVAEQKVVDSGAGFLIEEDDDLEKALVK